MKPRILIAIALSLLLISTLSAEIIKQQSFEENVSDTWGYTLSPASYYTTSPSWSVWARDNEGIPASMLPLPDGDGEYLWTMEYTSFTSTELHEFIFDTVDLSSYTGELSAHFYYYTFVYGSSSSSWSGDFDSIGYYVEYNNGTDWNNYTALDKGTNAWVQVNFTIPDTAQYFRLCIAGKNDREVEVAAFDYIYLLEEIGEPTNHVESLSVSSLTDNSITVTWADNNGAQPAEGFLVKIAQGSTPAAPVDGIEEHPSATIKQIAPGTQTATFTGLAANTAYTITIYPYTNLDVFIDYKTNVMAPIVMVVTPDTPTPICLGIFKAEAKPEGINLMWETASESENSGFILYRDNEAIAFIEGAGTTTESHTYSFTDNNVVPSNTYTYILADLSYANIENRFENKALTVSAASSDGIDLNYEIKSAYPNPFNPMTTLEYILAETNNVEIDIYNMKGEKITSLVSGTQTAGNYSLSWNADNVQSGIYVLRISIGSHLETQKLLLIK